MDHATASHWPRWLRAAARLGMAPDAFWKLSLKEWRMLMQREEAHNALNRDALVALIRQVEEDRPHGGQS